MKRKYISVKRLTLLFIFGFFIVFSCSEEYLSALAKSHYLSEYNTVVYITDTGEKYHQKGCRYLSDSCIEIKLGDAVKTGYAPCLVCKPPEFEINPEYE